MAAVGFELTPLRTGAWSQRLRPLGQTVVLAVHGMCYTAISQTLPRFAGACESFPYRLTSDGE